MISFIKKELEFQKNTYLTSMAEIDILLYLLANYKKIDKNITQEELCNKMKVILSQRYPQKVINYAFKDLISCDKIHKLWTNLNE